ncbi:hypothetical protein, partial [Oceanospirillum sediminis]|uniref:hypothetical protein n=1 Tax=Oceanospirillum sediminis TaxID=2760088 RepID=UPI001C723E98
NPLKLEIPVFEKVGKQLCIAHSRQNYALLRFKEWQIKSTKTRGRNYQVIKRELNKKKTTSQVHLNIIKHRAIFLNSISGQFSQ